MEHLLRAVQSRMKERKLYRPAIGLIVKEVCKQYAVDPSELAIKISNSTCTVLLSSQEDKTTWFLKRADLLDQINKKLAHDGREVQFTELRIK